MFYHQKIGRDVLMKKQGFFLHPLAILRKVLRNASITNWYVTMRCSALIGTRDDFLSQCNFVRAVKLVHHWARLVDHMKRSNYLVLGLLSVSFVTINETRNSIRESLIIGVREV